MKKMRLRGRLITIYYRSEAWMVGYALLLPSIGLSPANATLVLHLLGTMNYSSQLISYNASQGLMDGHFAFHFS